MMLPAALCVVGTLLVCCRLSPITADSREEDLPGPCSVTLAPEGPCGKEKDECPFVLNLPPLTVSLPNQLKELEKIVEELQLLKDNVDELRKMCGDCAVSQTERECGRQTEHETLREERIRVSGNERSKYAIKADVESDKQIWERVNIKGVVNEERATDGKPLGKDKVEQVVAVGKNVRITQRKNSDRKQKEGDGGEEENTLRDKEGMSNAKTFERNSSHLWQDKRMENPKQTEAGPEKTHLSIVEDRNEQTQHYILQDKSSTVGNRDEMDISDQHIWQDNNHKEPEPEKYEEKDYVDPVEDGEIERDKKFSKTDENKEEKTDSDRPVWRDKTQVDKNQMETDRYEEKEGRREEGKTISRVGDKKKPTQSGRHVWRAETMETAEGGSAERTKMSEDGDEHTDGERDHVKEIEENNGKSKQTQREKSIKETGEEFKGKKPVQSYREVQNRKVMEGTDLNPVSQASAINFIDLDLAVTLTSPPSFTTSHLTTDVKPGQRITTYEAPPQSSHSEKDTDSEHSSVDATSHSATASTDVKLDEQKTVHGQKSQSNRSEKGRNSEHSSVDAQTAKTATTTVFVLSGLVEGTTSTPPSTTTLRHSASFEDEIESTTFTSRQISPTTTSPAVAGNKRWISPKKKTITKARPSQSPKLSQKLNVGMKPGANPKLKNSKNDRKLDQVPSPDSKAKNDQRPKPVNDLKDRPGKAPERVQISQTDQRHLQVRENEMKNRLPSSVSIRKPPTRRPSLPPVLENENITSTTGLETDEHPEPHVTSTPKYYKKQINKSDEQEKPGAILTNEGKLKPDQRSKPFSKPVKKTEPAQNMTRSILLNQNNQVSSELNATKERPPKPNLGPKANLKVPQINQKPKVPHVPKVKPIHHKLETSQKTKVKPKPEQAPKDKLKIPKPNQTAESKNSSMALHQPGHRPPTKPLKPGAKLATKAKPAVKPKSTESPPNAHADMAPTSGPVKSTTERTNSQRGTEFITTTTKDPVSESPKTTHDPEADPLLYNNPLWEGIAVSSNSRVTSDGGPQTTNQPSSISLTTLPNKTTQASTNSTLSQNVEEKVQKVQTSDLDRFTSTPSRVHISPTVRSDLRSTTSAASGPKASAFKVTTPSTRELRVKINQVAAFLNKSIPHPAGRHLDVGPGDHHEDKQAGRITDEIDSKYPAVKPPKGKTCLCSHIIPFYNSGSQTMVGVVLGCKVN